MPSNSEFLSSNVKFWPLSISSRFLRIYWNSYPMFFTVRYPNLMNKSAEFCGLSWLKEVDERGLLFLFPPGIYISRIFAVADAFLTTDVSALPLYSQLQMLFFRSNVSATCSSLNVQILFNLSVTHNCIYILSFLGGEDTSFVNFASLIFENLLSQIPSPKNYIHNACPVKFCYSIYTF